MKYTVRKVMWKDPLTGMPSSITDHYLVSDAQGFDVCQCDRQHNAELICRLLNNHT